MEEVLFYRLEMLSDDVRSTSVGRSLLIDFKRLFIY